MAGAKIISLVDVKLREEMVMRDTILDELMTEMAALRDLIDALQRDFEQIKQGGVDVPSKCLTQHPKSDCPPT